MSFCNGATIGQSWKLASQPLNNICHMVPGGSTEATAALVSQSPMTYTALVVGKHRTVQQSQIMWWRLEALQMTKYCGMFVKGSNTTPNSSFPVSAHCTHTYTHTRTQVHTHIHPTWRDNDQFCPVQLLFRKTTCVHSSIRLTPRNDGLQHGYKTWAFWPSSVNRLNNLIRSLTPVRPVEFPSLPR